jgi:hypothetical protein
MTDPDTKIRTLLEDLAGEASLDPGLERRTLRRARRRRAGSAVVALAVTAGIVAGGVLTVRQFDTGAAGVPAGQETPTPTAVETAPAVGPTPEPTPTPSLSPGPQSPTPPVSETFATDLEDGRYIVIPTTVDMESDPATLEFDLAEFYSGDAANEYAAAHGMETPVPNDNLIINENPKLRLMPLSPGVEIDVVDYGNCNPCDPANLTIDLATFAQRVRDAQFHNAFWLTIQGDTIVKIQEQFQP